MIDKIVIKLTTSEEDRTPERAEKNGAGPGFAYAPGFAIAVRGMQKQARKHTANSKWGWCTVDVTARILTTEGGLYEGRDSLGECSYESAEDFIANSMYYWDMVKTATEEALKKYNDARANQAIAAKSMS